MLRSGFTKQLLEANILLFIEPERVLITRSFRLPGISVCLFTIGIHIWLKKGSRLGRTPSLAERAPLYAEKLFGIQRYSLLLSGDNKIRGGKFFVKTLKSLRGRVFPGAILQPSGDEKKPAERTGTDVSGHRNRGISVDCILHHERQVFLFRSLFRYKPHETENGILNGLKHKTKHTRFTTV